MKITVLPLSRVLDAPAVGVPLEIGTAALGVKLDRVEEEVDDVFSCLDTMHERVRLIKSNFHYTDLLVTSSSDELAGKLRGSYGLVANF